MSAIPASNWAMPPFSRANLRKPCAVSTAIARIRRLSRRVIARRRIPAHVALLSSGTDHDVDEGLPGSADPTTAYRLYSGSRQFGSTPPTNSAASEMFLCRTRVAGRWVAQPGTQTLLRIPESISSENRLIEVREVRLAEMGKASFTETTEVFGAWSAITARYYHQRAPTIWRRNSRPMRIPPIFPPGAQVRTFGEFGPREAFGCG